MPKLPENFSLIEKASLKLTSAIGTPISIIVHSCMFVGIFGLMLFGFQFDQVMLILTTLVSLEAIYLSIFIQMTVNRNTASLEVVEENIDDISENVEDMQEDIGEIEGDVDKIHLNVTEISKDVDSIVEDVDVIQDHVENIGDDVDKIQEHVEEIGDDVEELQEDDDDIKHIEESHVGTAATLATIQSQLQIIMKELETLKQRDSIKE